ncbi:MAG TPA: sigma-70 family RNA polymerase sigma factor [Cytophagales bacterium]|nr:sigma-70 family RNA polymerase sigma factor [Cytophagales bacterium]
MDKVQQEVDHLYKKYFGKMVASLLYFSQEIDLETAEDLVQDSYSSALTSWKSDGIPANPEGWIYKVCKNKALNKIKKEKRVRGITVNEDFLFQDPHSSDSVVDDYQLRLLFACAHPDLSPKVQVVITLKYVINLKIESIAKVLAMTIDGVDKLLSRARQKIREEKVPLQEPDVLTLHSRIHIVHKILYLLFNEGYKSSWGKELLREELCEEALLMAKTLIDGNIGNKETAALYALMLFNAARFKARIGSNGELLDLEEQDRSLWNKDLIRYACTFLHQSKGGPVSSYHYEATIAYLHCTAKDFNSTDWVSVSKLYLQLLQMNPNPFVELNYSIALYYSGQKKKAFKILNELQQKPFFNQYYLLNATLGKFNLLEGNNSVAREFFLKTLQQTEFEIEKEYIRKQINKIKN